MAYKYREELVGKRFLSVSGSTNLSGCDISEWGWKSGIIRAATHRDTSHQDLQVLVEFDNIDWQRREWQSVYLAGAFKYFFVEKTLNWAPRSDRKDSSKWPAISFQSLVFEKPLDESKQPIEYLQDNVLTFADSRILQPFLEWDSLLPAELQTAVHAWKSFQDGQRILTTTPSVLGGCRAKVYRVVGTTQWYTAVIVGYSENSGELTVTDDTVLEEHSVDPALVQMRLLGDVVESIMRGEVLGVMPRRSRSSLHQINTSMNRDNAKIAVTAQNNRKKTVKNNGQISTLNEPTIPPPPPETDKGFVNGNSDAVNSVKAVRKVNVKNKESEELSEVRVVVASEEDDCVIVCARDGAGSSDSGVSGLSEERSGSRSSAVSEESWRGMAHLPHLPPPAAGPALYPPPPSDLLWKPRYHGPPHAAPHHLVEDYERAYTHERERERMLRERREQEQREINEKKEKDRVEKIVREREREKVEREERERREEKERQGDASKLVHKHFEESLRLANQKRDRAGTWSIINTLSPGARDQERLPRDHERLHRPYYPPTSLNHQVQRPPSAPAKTDYPSPAHGRLTVPQKPQEKSPTVHAGLPKAEPNFSAYGYPSYRPNSYDKNKLEPGKHPITDRHIGETKNSVIVKHDTKPPQIHLEHKHSPYGNKSNLVRSTEYHPQRPYRSGLSPITSHATSLVAPPVALGQHANAPLASSPLTATVADKTRARVYHSPTQHRAQATYYYPQVGGRPKVSSPAPPHMYGKPVVNPELAAVPVIPKSEPPPVPYPPPTAYMPAHRGRVPPPPAHPCTQGPRSPPRAHGAEPPAPCQLQPLDLGVSSRQEDPDSPRRRYPYDPAADPSDPKRRKTDSPLTSVAVSPRTEPSPQIATAVTAAISVRPVCGIDAAPHAPVPPSDVRVPSADGSIGTPEKASEAASPGPLTAASPLAAAPAEPPVPSPPAPSAPVRHLGKKAWLQRHETAPSGVQEKPGGESVCVTLPMDVAPTTAAAPSTPSPNKSLHRIGTMAVNSIGRTKTPKQRKNVKESEGRTEEARANSSSSDREIEDKPKRKPPKTKKRKANNVRKAADEPKKKKSSDSGSDSDKESDGAADSDSGNGARRGRRGRRRGRAPDRRRRRPPSNGPTSNPTANKHRRTSESFLQNGACCDIAPKLAKCRECRWSPNERDGTAASIFCRFYHFRRLRYTKNGQLAIAGFSDPHNDADSDDEKLWTTSPNTSELDIEMSCFLLREIGDHFCRLLAQERRAKELHQNEDKSVIWKRVVQGVREMCDVCETTLFNFHWTCGKCGFVVCIDCYKTRTSESSENVKVLNQTTPEGDERDKHGWLTCAHGGNHDVANLLLTQIAARSALSLMCNRMHQVRGEWGLRPCAACSPAKTEPNPVALSLLSEAITQNQKQKSSGNRENGPDGHTNAGADGLSWFDVPNTNDIKNDESGSSSSSDEGSTLRELLAGGNNGANKASANSKGRDKGTARAAAVLGAIGGAPSAFSERHPLIMTFGQSRTLYPKTPHAWLCGGRLLHLTDPQNPANYSLFQELWKRGQPVLVSDVLRQLSGDLWTPQSFSRDFGHKRVDLINCSSGLVVPNQPASRFWDGFESVATRLRDERGATMVLKIKDWPPGEDFAETMPARFDDLMRALPLREYTARNGSLNLAARLPECLVRPDLGPKMYTAYGGAGGTTNLHVDVSDAVNVLVHASCPRDGPERLREAKKAADASGADEIQRRRARNSPAALWHIYSPSDADRIRDLLSKLELDRGSRPAADPVHDQTWYLDAALRERLYREYGVEGYTILQCPGDAVFVPAGAPHQVRNLLDCIKVAEDFVSPENVSKCFQLAQQFRMLSAAHVNKEDKLQIKNIAYHAVKDSVCKLEAALKQKEH